MARSQTIRQLLELGQEAVPWLKQNAVEQRELQTQLSAVNGQLKQTEDLIARLEAIQGDKHYPSLASLPADPAQPEVELSLSTHASIQSLSLPWLKHKYNIELSPNADGQERDAYMNTIKFLPWTPGEVKKLQEEILRFGHLQEYRVSGQQPVASTSSGTDADQTRAIIHRTILDPNTDWQQISNGVARRKPNECRIQANSLRYANLSIVPGAPAASKRAAAPPVDQLVKLVEAAPTSATGRLDWWVIEREMGGRWSIKELVRAYRQRDRKDKWTAEDDKKLKEAIGRFGENWQAVAAFMGKHSNQCINRWTKTTKPDIKRGKWSAEEDEALRAAVMRSGTETTPKWKEISAWVTGRTDAQCRERWVNVLDPKLNRSRIWNAEEDATILRLKNDEGKSWAEIAHVGFADTRTDNHVKARYEQLSKDPNIAPKKRGRPKKDPNAPSRPKKASAKTAVRKAPVLVPQQPQQPQQQQQQPGLPVPTLYDPSLLTSQQQQQQQQSMPTMGWFNGSQSMPQLPIAGPSSQQSHLPPFATGGQQHPHGQQQDLQVGGLYSQHPDDMALDPQLARL